MTDSQPILILGAGINGVAIARELLLNNVSVTIVDRADPASGASAYNSRLIHGGLRYLEYGEFDLVRESLAERERLLRLAPHLVKPLKLFIPCENRFGGLINSARRFLGWKSGNPKRSRGWWLVSYGLKFYDRYAKGSGLAKSESQRVGEPETPPVDANRYHWLCSYFDAQIMYPERLVQAMIADCRKIAADRNLQFELHTYHSVERKSERFIISPTDREGESFDCHPIAVVNATGASVDDSLQRIEIESKRLIGGTKGSHIITRHAKLREALDEHGIYSEAADGRPVFVLPFGEAVLIGTTDIPYNGDPAEAIAVEQEIAYLIAAVNRIFPAVQLTKDDVDQHYCGVRPLPHVDAASTSSITRRHWLHRHDEIEPPLFSVIGGKLTTCRQLAEDATAAVLPTVGMEVRENSRDRHLPGCAEGHEILAQVDELATVIATRYSVAAEQVDRMIAICGFQVMDLMTADPDNAASHPAHFFPPGFVRGVIRQEQPKHLTDLVERRLMLVYDPRLSPSELHWLAGLLAEEGVIASQSIDKEVTACEERMRTMFGKKLAVDKTS